jgi:hypothetical protein
MHCKRKSGRVSAPKPIKPGTTGMNANPVTKTGGNKPVDARTVPETPATKGSVIKYDS